MLESMSRQSSLRRRLPMACISVLAPLLISSIVSPTCSKVFGSTRAGGLEGTLWPISVDYPLEGSIFPPGITPPTFIWRDPTAISWQIQFAFVDHSAPVQVQTSGERMHIGPIDPTCVSSTNELPKLTPRQGASWTWSPDAPTWAVIQARSIGRPATLTITGYNPAHQVTSQARVTLSTSVDPVGAPIFYRDVPLMPSEGANGIVQPLAPTAIHLINWRIRDVRHPPSAPSPLVR